MTLSDYEIGWLVGILEGEGYFGYDGCTQIIKVGMTDEDTMITFTNLISRFLGVHVDMVLLDRGRRHNEQDIYVVRICGQRARKVMRLVVPCMHFRRRQKIWQALNKYKIPKNKTKINLEQLVSEGMEKGLIQ